MRTALARLLVVAALVWVCGAGSCTVSYNAKTRHHEDDEEEQQASAGVRPVGLVLELGPHGATPRFVVLAPR